MRGSFEDWDWGPHPSSWNASRSAIEKLEHIAPLLERRVLADPTSGASHIFDYAHRTAFGLRLVETAGRAHPNGVFVWPGSQDRVMLASADHGQSFFDRCRRHPEWRCGNYVHHNLRRRGHLG